ncbi:MAG: hypothetical protein LC794_06015 [Acidobacteria bacterium]|nr:hypothetical protein [Acidobacteriota bacterium]
MNRITLPEITIEGDPDSPPITEADWWANGFTQGFNSPDETPERPLLINDDLAALFFFGVDNGKEAQAVTAAEIDALLADQPSIEGDIDGPTLESVRRQFEEDFSGLLDPEHEPHIEVEPPAIVPRLILR